MKIIQLPVLPCEVEFLEKALERAFRNSPFDSIDELTYDALIHRLQILKEEN